MMKNSLALSDIFYLIITAVELSAGVVANGFIVGLNCIDWAKSRTMTSYDMIITSLAFSRFCLQFLVSSDNFLHILYPDVCDMVEIIMMMLVIWMFINHVSLCFASCLSVFYCVKIATFNQSFFTWLKLKLSRLVPWLLLGSLLYCLVTTVTFTFFSYFFMITSHICPYRPSRNITIPEKEKNLTTFVFLIHGVGSIFPLILFIASSLLLIISLCRHIRKMNLNSDLNPSFRNSRTDAHVSALKSVLSFFIIYNIFYVASTLSIGTGSYFSAQWKIMLCTLVVAAYPSVHSFVLILVNPKLKLASARILHSANCCFREVTS